MRVLKRNPWLTSLGVLLAVLVVYGGYARADVTTDQPGSIVIFPKVISDGTRDTLIQLTNTSTSDQQAHCFYIDASNASPGQCTGPVPISGGCTTDDDCVYLDSNLNPIPDGQCVHCNEIDFDIALTPLQPTVWRVSAGRDSSDQSDGIFIGKIDPKPLFTGELKCFQTDNSGVPMGGNALKGEATIETLASGQISEYNAISILALNTTTVQPTCVGGGNDGNPCSSDADCEPDTGGFGICKTSVLLDNTTEYNACPTSLILNHFAQGATDPIAADLGTGGTVTTEVTLVPCTEDLEGQSLPLTTVAVNSVNELESRVTSYILPLFCWSNFRLDDPQFGGGFAPGPFGSQFGKTRFSPTSSGVGGILGVAEEFHVVSGQPDGTAAFNLHVEGNRPGDTIQVPLGPQGQP
jgi:hypothetical protein